MSDHPRRTASAGRRWWSAVAVPFGMVVGLAFAAVGVGCTTDWRAAQQSAQLRVDVLGRQRTLAYQLLASTMRLASFDPGDERDQLPALLWLAQQSWQAVGEGGPERGLDLAATGRQLAPWPQLITEHAATGDALTAYLARIVRVNNHNIATSVDVLELNEQAKILITQLDQVVRDSDDEARSDPRLEYAVALFVLAAVAFVGSAMAAAWRSRRRRAALEQGRAAASDAERRLARLLEHAHDALMIWTEDDEPRWVSPSFQRLFGREPPTTGAGMLDLVHPDDRHLTLHTLSQARRHSGEAFTVDYRILHGDGRWIPTVAIATGHVDDPLVQGVLVTLRDLTAERAAAHELADAAALHRFFDANSTELMIRADGDGRILYASSASGPMLELDPSDLVGAHVTDLVDPADREVFVQMLSAAERSGSATRADLRFSTAAADQSIWVSADVSYVVGPSGAVELHVSVSDIRDRVEAEVRLADERRLLAATLANVSAGVLAVDSNGRVIEANNAYVSIVGFSPNMGDHVDDVLARYRVFAADGGDLINAERPIVRALFGDRATDVSCVLESADGTVRHVVANAVPLDRDEDDDGRGGAVLTLNDVTALHLAQEELHKLAMNDTLTGLANRRRLLEFLTEAHRRNVRSPERLAVLFLDLDGFKAINDRLGHAAGDELLAQAGQRIVATVRDGDFVARFGGDEFVVVAENLHVDDGAATLAQRMEAALSEPFELCAGPVTIGGSVGIALMAESDSPHTLLVEADRAMYDRKRVRKGISAPG